MFNIFIINYLKIKLYLDYFMKFFYRIILKEIFDIIYGKIKKFKNENNKENLKKNNLKFHNKIYKFFEIKKGRIFTDCNTNVAYITKNNQLTNFSFQQNRDRLSSIKHNFVLKYGTPKIKKKVNGNVLSLVQGASGNNYWHWLFDLLPKVEILSVNKKINLFDYYYVPKLNRYIVDSLKIYGIKERQLINSQKFKHLEANKIFFLENIYLKKGNFQKQFEKIPKVIVRTIRNRFLGYRNKKFYYKKVFIDRSDSKFSHYQFFNNEVIIKKLKKKKFGIYKLSELSIFDQISLFNSSRLVLGLHGAGFANIIFCKKKTKIFEILRKNEIKRNAVKTVSKLTGLKHRKIIIKKYKYFRGYNQLIFNEKYYNFFK